MKKIIVFLFCISSIFINNKNSDVVIPTNSIRFRIVASDNSIEEQELKIKIKEELNKEIVPILEKATSLEEEKELITNNLDNIKNIVSKYTDNYNINFGNNYFPEKEYKGIIYKEGYYDSLVITLGKGNGKNFWCVLYPPLCLIDENNNEYYSLIKEILSKE